jgi:N-acyl-D-aspartate/D-glutamate deacylase
MVESEREAIELGKAVGIPAKLAHLKATGLINKGRIGEVIAMVEAARVRGFDIVADQYPFDGATVRAVYDLFVLPDGRGDRQVKEAEVRASLADPARRSAVREATENGVDKGFSWIKAVGYGSMRIVDAPENPDLVDENIELLAKKRGIAPFDLLADLAALNNVRVTLGTIDEADILELIVKPWVMIASDGAYVDAKSLARGYAHPRASGSFTRVLGHYSRDLKLFPLEEAIRKMTGFPAAHLGLADRGRLMPGLAADVVLFDPATVGARATYADPGASSTGIATVIVNGKVAFENGKPTGITAGQFVSRKR